MSKKIRYEDLANYYLPVNIFKKFTNLIEEQYSTFLLPNNNHISGIKAWLNYSDQDEINKSNQIAFFASINFNGYTLQPAYTNTNDASVRAKLAFMGPTKEFKKTILALWREATKDMTNVEKSLLGWDKL